MREQYPRTALFGTEERTLFCPTLGREYHLSVALPASYGTSTRAYPVICVLDGDLLFGMAAGLTPLTQWLAGVPEVIVVGIRYDMASYDQWVQLRERDFKIPEVRDAPPDSAANLFLDALTQEMLPFIEANYRTMPSDRALYGYSSSGFFVLYALFHRPDAFRRYLSGSGDPHFHQLVAFFERENYPGLTVIPEIYAGERHGSEGVALTYLHGLRMLYPPAER